MSDDFLIHTAGGEIIQKTPQGFADALINPSGDPNYTGKLLVTLASTGECWAELYRHGRVRITRDLQQETRRQPGLPFHQQQLRIEAAVTFSVPATISVEASTYDEARHLINAYRNGRIHPPCGFRIDYNPEDLQAFFNGLDIGNYDMVEDIKPLSRL